MVAAAAAAVYVLVLVVVPLVDRSLDVWSAHPEDYVRGPYGLAVNVSYAALAVAIALLVASLPKPTGWTLAVPVLFIPAGILCVALTFDPLGVAGGNAVFLLPVFGLALGPLVASLTLGADLRPWNRALAVLAGLALAAFALMLVEPSIGFFNRVFDVLAGAWIASAALALRRPQAKLSAPIAG